MNNKTAICTEILKYHRAVGWSKISTSEQGILPSEALLGYSNDQSNLITDLWIKCEYEYESPAEKDEIKQILNSSDEISINLTQIPFKIKKYLDYEENVKIFVGCYLDLPNEIKNQQQPRLFYDYENKKYYNKNIAKSKNIALIDFTFSDFKSQNQPKTFSHEFKKSITKVFNENFCFYLNIQIINNINEFYIETNNNNFPLSFNISQSTIKTYELTLEFSLKESENICVLKGSIPHGKNYSLRLLNASGGSINENSNNKIPSSIGLYQNGQFINQINIPQMYRDTRNTFGEPYNYEYNFEEISDQPIQFVNASWEQKIVEISFYELFEVSNSSYDTNEIKTIEYSYNNHNYTSATPPEIKDYIFSGWFIKENNNYNQLDINLNTDNSFTVSNLDAFYHTAYYAKYEPIEYPIVYITNDGEMTVDNRPFTYNITNKAAQINNIKKLEAKKEGYIGSYSFSESLDKTLICSINWVLDKDYSNHIRIIYENEEEPISIIPENQPITFPCVYNDYRLGSVKVGENYYSCHHKYNTIADITFDNDQKKQIIITNLYCIDGTDVTEAGDEQIKYWPIWIKNEQLNKWEPGYSLNYKPEGGNWI